MTLCQREVATAVVAHSYKQRQTQYRQCPREQLRRCSTAKVSAVAAPLAKPPSVSVQRPSPSLGEECNA